MASAAVMAVTEWSIAMAYVTQGPVPSFLAMPDRPNKESVSAHYRRLAEQCLEIVPTIQDQESRAALVEMARVWMRLAESYRADKSIPPAPTKETRPVIQQQEQVQPKKDDDKD